MPSQLLKNDAISFVVAKPFTSQGKTYEVGQDFPQEDARDIEVFVRARYVIPVLENPEDKQHIRHWHRELRPKDEVLSRLSRDRVQLAMPQPYDSEEVVALNVLTHPETTPEPTQESPTQSRVGEDQTPPELEAEDPDEPTFDPGDHTVTEVESYLASHPQDRDRVLAAEEAGRGRKGLLEE